MSSVGSNAVAAVLLVPLAGAALLAVLPGYRLSALLNVAISALTLGRRSP